MIVTKLVSAKEAVEKFYTDTRSQNFLTEDEVKLWTAEIFDLIKFPLQYIPKVIGHKQDPAYDFKDYKVPLPCDFVAFIPGGISVNGNPVRWRSNSFHYLMDGDCCDTQNLNSTVLDIFTDQFGNVKIENGKAKSADNNDRNAKIFEEFANFYLYDRVGGKYNDAKLTVLGKEYSLLKSAQAAMRFFSLKTLALSPLSGTAQFVGGTGNDDGADYGTTTDIQDVIDDLNLNTVLADTTSILNNISDGKDKDGYVDITGLDGTTVTQGPLNLTTAFDFLGETTPKNGVVTITDANGGTNTGSVNTSIDAATDTSTSVPNVVTKYTDAQDDGTTDDITKQIDALNLARDYRNDLGLYLTNVADSIYGPTANLAYSPNPFATPTYGTSNGVAGGGSAKPYDDWSSAAYAKGGKVTPDRLMGPDPTGPDDGYAALKSGEFVLNEKSAKEIGYEVLKRLNARNR